LFATAASAAAAAAAVGDEYRGGWVNGKKSGYGVLAYYCGKRSIHTLTRFVGFFIYLFICMFLALAAAAAAAAAAVAVVV
jgi:hypothetical protein